MPASAHQPAHPVALRAELGVERHAIQRGTRLSSRDRRSRSQKCRASENRARSTRSLPATIAAPPSGASMLATNAKMARPMPSGWREREIALVDPHGDLHDLRRQIHERGIDAPQQRHRPFHQACDLVRAGPDRPARSQRGLGGAGAAMPSAIRRAPFRGIGDHMACAQFGLPIGRPPNRKRARCQEAMAFGQIAAGQAMPVIGAVAQIENGTTLPSSRQTMRRSGRTQVNALVPPQRIDFGHGKRRSSAGMAPAMTAAASCAGVALSSTQKSPSWRSCSRAGAMLAQEAGQRLLRRAGARAALVDA